MGQELRCKARVDKRSFEAKVLFETDEIVIRGEKRVAIPLKDVAWADVAGDALRIAWAKHEASLELGAAAAKRWLEKIRNPKTRADKLGVKPGQKVSVIAVDDAALIEELTSRGADVATRTRKASDAIFFGANEHADLAKVESLKQSLQPAGALWIIRPKGTKAITEAATMAAGKAAGLVDVKVVKFSETHTAEKFVIPLASR